MDTHTVTALDRLHGFYFEDLEVGQSDEYSRTISESDILIFAGVSGDTNPVHLNHEFASETMFEGCIAHGLLTASYISTVIGTKMPGPGCIYVGQTLKFKGPVKAGDTVIARATILEKIEDKKFVKIQTQCLVGDKVVLDGEATIMVPSRSK
ncbi:MaoC family dehydratase [Thalassospiraceae bacterium LMO-SO8]|nr:MaoC family dehydratase [Alphaproteobacteria bacterium LMO-S08]WND77961.1 MaoC family dehydratase [Thalassospiraceae bacterium LMO-SO8]